MFRYEDVIFIVIAVLSRLEVIAQATVFFVAGYETTAATLQSLAYNLALYPEVQEKIVREFEEQLGDVSIFCSYQRLTSSFLLQSCIMHQLYAILILSFIVSL